MKTYFDCHSHTMYSNIRLLDCINRPKNLIDRAIELGLSGIAITDHECLSGHMEINQYAKKIREQHPDFTIALGNEGYLVDERESGIKYYHFIFIAKDAYGHKGLRELSSIAWYNAYTDRGMERVPVTKEELAKIMLKYRGHIIATSACMGGELSTAAYNMALAEKVKDNERISLYYNQIRNFINYCLNVFGDDFYIECAPSLAEDQCITNRKLIQIAQYYNIPVVLGSDAHYTRKEDRFVHKSFLNSKDGDREVDSFYEYTYLMSYDEVHEMLSQCFGSSQTAEWVLSNTKLIKNKITFYSLEHKQKIPKVEVEDYLPFIGETDFTGRYNKKWNFPTIDELLCSDDVQERYWINECLKALKEKNLYNTKYLQRIEIEADIIKYIGDKLDDCLFAYFNTFKHYIDLFWECGSIVGPGRGSATGFLSNYLLGITQLDPVRWNLPYWRLTLIKN